MAGPLAAAGKMVTAWSPPMRAWLRVAKGSPSPVVASRKLCSKAPQDGAQKEMLTPPPAGPKTSFNENVYKDAISPSRWKKKMLLLTRRYNKEEDIPEFVPHSVMQAAASRLRVYVGTGLTIFTLICFFFAARSGKHSLEQGRSLRTIHMEKKAKYLKEMAENDAPKV